MAAEYADRWISCDADAITVRGYYFPWGTKTIEYGEVLDVRPTVLGIVRGRLRVWGAGDPRYWFHLDPRRPSKETGFVLDLAATVHPVLTPDDPDAFAEVLRRHGVRFGPDVDGPRFA